MTEDIIQESEFTEKQENGKRLINPGVSYPVETVPQSLAVIDKLVATFGSSAIISKEDISNATGKKVNTLVLTFSTYQQYGILEKVHGKGFKTSLLYKKYADKVYPNDEREAMLEMFKNPPLYTKLIDKLNNTYLPSEDRFPTLLKGDPYNVNPNSTDKASKVFFENVRGLNLLVNNSLRYSLTSIVSGLQPNLSEKPPVETPPPADKTGELFELPIPLPGKQRIAYLRYPIDTLTPRDITVISKALAFIKSSISDEDDEETKKE